MNARSLLFATLIASVSLVAQPAKADHDFKVECEVLDPETREPRDTFSGGDKILLRVDIEVASGVMRGDVQLKTSMSARILGRKFKVRLRGMNVDIPNQQERSQIEGFEDIEDEIPKRNTFVREETTLKLPKKMPTSTYKLKVSATAKFVRTFEDDPSELTTRNVKCSQEIDIVQD